MSSVSAPASSPPPTTVDSSASASAPTSGEFLSSIISSVASSISSVASSSPDPTSSATPTPSKKPDLFEEGAGTAQDKQGISLETFLASLAVAAIVFGAQVVAFVLIRKKLTRVYQPRTYLVPERRRTPAPPKGFINWFKPIFNTATSDFISKSGLDAYFFLRYLMMLLRTFGLVALVTLPILLPMNYVGGKGGDEVQGLDRFAWSNVAMTQTKRYWAHLVLAVLLVCVFCYTAYDELRKYIRMRQMYLTSPQHRLKASATTVLVSGIPRSWLTVQRLVELYDVFPGGIRNVWINRNFDPLQEKVDERDWLAKCLEQAETELIRKAWKNHQKTLQKEAKARGEKLHPQQDAGITNIGPGMSSGDPHQIEDHPGHRKGAVKIKKLADGRKIEIPFVTEGLEKVGHGVMGGLGAVTTGFKKFAGGRGKEMEVGEGEGKRASREVSNEAVNKRGSTLCGPDGEPLMLTRTRTNRTRRTSMAPSVIDTTVGGDVQPTEEKKDGEKKGHFWHRKSHSKHRRGLSDEAELTQQSPQSPVSRTSGIFNPIDAIEKAIWGEQKQIDYGPAHDPKYEGEDWGEPVWKKYIAPKERPTMHLPIASFMPSIPFIGKKVDTITYCRKELARLNLEIETDQQHLENYPLMNSAFIQFNQQVAAHMACQSLSHHVPQHMAPRHIEVSPNDVIWGNMRMQWWERYIRSFAVTAATIALVFGWAAPVAAVGSLSQVEYLEGISWLKWIAQLPDNILGVVSGVLPPVFLAILMAVLPIILRAFARIAGAHTGMAIEQKVQGMYFMFLFVQVFLVVSISSGITTVIKRIADSPVSAPAILAQNLPKASNFFFSYLLLQAFSISSAALLQVVTLFINFVVAPIVDNTARQKFSRATTLQEVKWGTFFPVYTNLACIGIVYSVISPLILVFNMITFSLFWVVYRYNLLFVVNFKFDTGGLLFPRAINQLFTGIYVMEVCLIGLFFLVRDKQERVACAPQAIIMIVVAVLTAVFQMTLNKAFEPLLTYLPITLEDDAAIRDQEFAAAQEANRHLKHPLTHDEQPGEDLNETLARRERMENNPDAIELTTMNNHTSPRSSSSSTTATTDPSTNPNPANPNLPPGSLPPSVLPPPPPHLDPESLHPTAPPKGERPTIFSDVADEIEDLSPEERDILVARAFQHPAVRAKRPVIWIPRDRLGVSDDEVQRTRKMTANVWISNEYAGLDERGRVGYGRPPPDMDYMATVEL